MPKLPCQSGDPDRWFPASGLDPKQTAALKAECAECPILDSCREWGIVHGEHGIWGATTDGERAAIRKHRGVTPKRIVMSIDAERDAKVRGMVQRGHSTADIAAALGVSLSAAEQARLRVQRSAS
jgi:hypothetical protein